MSERASGQAGLRAVERFDDACSILSPSFTLSLFSTTLPRPASPLLSSPLPFHSFRCRLQSFAFGRARKTFDRRVCADGRGQGSSERASGRARRRNQPTPLKQSTDSPAPKRPKTQILHLKLQSVEVVRVGCSYCQRSAKQFHCLFRPFERNKNFPGCVVSDLAPKLINFTLCA